MQNMKPLVSIIMGSMSDLPVVSKCADFLDSMEIPFEMLALSAHRTPLEVEKFARGAEARGIHVIIAAAGMSAALPGVISALTPLPVIGLPLDATLGGKDAALSMLMMPPGVTVATVGINAAVNAAVLATEILALGNTSIALRLKEYRNSLSQKVVKANDDLQEVHYKFKTN